MDPCCVPDDDYQAWALRQNMQCSQQFVCHEKDVDRGINLAPNFWEKEMPEYEQKVSKWKGFPAEKSFRQYLEYWLA